ncbi:hypothetical protein FIV00_26230 [Labrenzia sp. THAF82]|nr:hypothetical protein FIV00_26230 [Labrenzia sp. THAF82]
MDIQVPSNVLVVLGNPKYGTSPNRKSPESRSVLASSDLCQAQDSVLVFVYRSASVLMAAAMLARGHRSYVCEPTDLGTTGECVSATAGIFEANWSYAKSL